MANDLTNMIPRILAMGIEVLRGAVIMPRLVSTEYESDARKKGSTVDVPIAPEIAVRDVVPGANQVAAGDINPGLAQIVLDQWKEAPFYLTDNDFLQVEQNIIPLSVGSAIAAMASTVNAYIMSKYKKVYGFTGTPGSTPFGGTTPTTSDASQTGKVLTQQLAPVMARRMVLDPEAAALARDLSAFQDASASADPQVITEGIIGRKLGFDFYEDVQVPEHIAGTIDGVSSTWEADASQTAGTTALATTFTQTTGTDVIDIKEGDIITLAGDSQTYVVTADASRTGAGALTVNIRPGLQVAIGGAAVAIVLKGDHRVNLAFNRDAFAFASRPLLDTTRGTNAQVESLTDPVSGISLRLEITRQHKQTEWSFDILYGAECIDPRKAARLAG
jgi:hypothetical protein